MSGAASDIGQARRIDVAVVHDGNMLAPPIMRVLLGHFRVGEVRLETPDIATLRAAKAIVFCLARVKPQQAPILRRLAARFPAPPIFVFPTFQKENLDVAEGIEGAAHFVAPINRKAVTNAVRTALQRGVEAAWAKLRPVERTALTSSVESFDAAFGAIAKGEKMPIAQVYSACENIQATLADTSVDRWLDALQQHHDSSFRHSMLVCGALAFFSHDLGIRGEDLRKITVGTFLHDAGKALVPVAILDKPGKLEPDEFKVIQRHPVYSREVLTRQEDVHPDVIAMAASHHEKLDGTGYPDGLKGGQISDIVRLTAIADVYSALVEERAYKPGMSNERAFKIMLGQKDHLDTALTMRFREYVMDVFQTEAA